MSRRFFSVCTLIVLLIALSPLSLPGQIEDTVIAPIAPRSPQAPCLVVPAALRQAPAVAASSSAWQFEPSMPTPRHSFGFAWLPATYDVYAIGGMLGRQEAVTATERYNVCSKTWTTMAPLPQPRGYVQAAELNGKLYVVGGVDRVISDTYQVHNETWVYDPISNTWSQAANFPQALGGVALAVVNSRLYAFGGFDAHGPSVGDVDTAYVYNPDNNTWLSRTAMISGTRSLAGAARLNDKIYVVGGTEPSISASMPAPSADMIVFNPATNSWSAAAPLLDAAHSPGVAVLPDAGWLYVIGGGIQWDPLVAGQVYDPATNTWSYLPDAYTDFQRVGSGVTYVAGRLLLTGGTSRVYGLNTNKVESYRLRDDFCNSSVSTDQPVILPGTHIVYTIELRSDIIWLNSAQVIDTLPVGTSFDGFIGNPSGATYDAGLRQVKWKGEIISHRDPIRFSFSVYAPLEGWHDGQTITNTAIFDDGLGHTFSRSAVTTFKVFDLSPSTKTVDQAGRQQ
jgi:N-acetylneuraminic acid mutarotase